MPSSSNKTTADRRLILAGAAVLVRTAGDVETVRGGPRCLHCGRRLRPNYAAERAPQAIRRYRRDLPDAGAELWEFDEARGMFWREIRRSSATSRRWLGSFGLADLFCNKSHAVAYAIATGAQLVTHPS